MQVAGHVLWPRAAWLDHGATFLVTLSFLVSGGLVSKLNNAYQKFLFYDILCQSFLWSIKQISVVKRKVTKSIFSSLD